MVREIGRAESLGRRIKWGRSDRIVLSVEPVKKTVAGLLVLVPLVGVEIV